MNWERFARIGLVINTKSLLVVELLGCGEPGSACDGARTQQERLAEAFGDKAAAWDSGAPAKLTHLTLCHAGFWSNSRYIREA